jgi:hypothetical protein
MRTTTARLTHVLALILVAAAAAPQASTPVEAMACGSGALAVRAEDPVPASCCFTNPQFSGTCEVRPAEDESCSQILAYLNNPMSKGKTYCKNTSVRGGWQSVACKPTK